MQGGAGYHEFMERPLGVTILAVLNFVVAAVMVGAGAAFLARGATVLRAAVTQRVLGQMGAGGLWLMIATSAVLALIMGVGLWRLKDWGRLLMLIFCIFGLITGALMLVAQLFHFVPVLVALRAATVAVYFLIVRYLLKPTVKEVFSQ